MSTVTRCSGVNLLGGPIATLAVAFALALLQVLGVTQVPGLGAILLACVVLSVLRGGWRSGVVSLVVFVAGCAWLKSRGTWRLAPAEALGLLAEVLVSIPITIAIGRLVTRLERAGRKERELRQASDEAREQVEAAHARLEELLGARVRAEAALRSRVLQQAAIAHIGRRALAGAPLQLLLDDAVEQLASVFDVDLAKVLERQSDGRLLLRAGVGWKPGLVGSAVIPPSAGSQAGYTLLSGAPVIVEDLRTERRFMGPSLLLDHGVVSGMSLVIPGPDGPYGILAVHSTRRCSFAHDDVAFLSGMAQVLALAYEWTRTTEQLHENQARVAAEQSARAAAESGAAARDEVLAIVSHDLRSPLATIVMAANTLELDGAEPKHTELIRRTVNQMLRLIRDLLEVSRIERGCELDTVRAEVMVAPLVQTVADAFALQAQRRSVALDVRIADGLPPIFADGERIIQALDNLMSNAMKFTPSGGRIAIEAATTGAAVRISVTDTGSGIAPEQVASLFQRYWQARTDRRGIGIGLSIVKGIVDAHDGVVGVEPRPGGGTRFFIELPIPATPANELAG